MPRSMTHDEVNAFLDERPGWLALSTLGPSGYPHTVPLGYFRLGGDLIMGVKDRTAKVRNIERDGRASAMLESGRTGAELKGVLVQGMARIVREPGALLELMREGARRRGVADADLPTSPRPGSVYIRLKPERVISWDYSSP